MVQKKKRTRKKLTAPTSKLVQRKRKQWSEADMIKALEEVAKGKYPLIELLRSTMSLVQH